METSYSFDRLPNEILCMIMRRLNGRDLSSAAMVCRKWLYNANYEKKLRGPYCVAIRHDIYGPAELQSNSIENLPIKSAIGFFFLPFDFYDFMDLYYGSFHELLPTNCKVVMLFTSIAILNDEIHRFQYSNYPNMVCAFLPQTPKVQLRTVITISENINAYIQMIQTAFIHPESSMCLMLFCVDNKRLFGEHMAEIARSTFINNKRISLCGGMMEHLEINNERNSVSSIAFLITGSIQTWSVVLEEEIKVFFKEKLQVFKEQVQLRKHTVCFVFYSYKQYRNNIDEELTIFKELFPNVPLVGCSCRFEFGRDTATYETKFLGSQYTKWFKKSSIVFMILTYG